MDTVRKVSNKIAIYYGRKYLMPYFIGLIAIAVNLIPILNGRDLLYEEFITLETMPMIIALKSKDINDILVAGITVTWPVIIDVFFDLLYKTKPTKNQIYFSVDWIFMLLPTFLFLYLYVIPNDQFKLCPILISSQITFGMCCCMYYLHANFPKIFQWHLMCLICLIRLTQGSVRSYSAFYQISPSATEIFARSCTAVMGFFLIILMLQWAYFMYQNRQEWTNLNDQDIYSLSNFIFVLIFLLFLSITNQSDGGNILKKDTNKIAIQLGFFVVVPAVQYVLHVRADRQLLVTSQQIIDTRAMLIRYISKRGMTALKLAAVKGHKECVELLLKHKANVNINTEDGTTALSLSFVKDKDSAIARLLISRNANKNHREKNGMTILMRAAEYGRLSIMKELLMNTTSTMKSSDSLSASEYNKKECNIQSEDGCTAMHYAASKGHVNVLIHLMDHGGDIKIQNQSGQTALEVLKNFYVNNNNEKEFRSFVEMTANRQQHLKMMLDILPEFKSPNSILNSYFYKIFNGVKQNSNDVEIVTSLVHIAVGIKNSYKKNGLEKPDLKERLATVEKMLVECMLSDALDIDDNVVRVFQDNQMRFLEDQRKDVSTVRDARGFMEGPLSLCIQHELLPILGTRQVIIHVDKVFKSSLRQNFSRPIYGLRDILQMRSNFVNFRSCPAVNFYFDGISKLVTFVLIALLVVNFYNSDDDNDSHSGATYNGKVTENILIIMIVAMVLHEIGEFHEAKWKWSVYLKDIWNCLDIAAIILLLAWLGLLFLEGRRQDFFPYSSELDNANIGSSSIGSSSNSGENSFLMIFQHADAIACLATSAVPISIGLLQYISTQQELGQLVLTVVGMGRDLGKFVVVFLTSIAGFGIAFHGMFAYTPNDEDTRNFHTVEGTVYTLFDAALGQHDFGLFANDRFHIWGTVLFLIYITMTMVLLLNLVIATFSATFDTMSKQAVHRWCLMKARHVQTYLIIEEGSPLSMLPAPLNLVPVLYIWEAFILMNKTKTNTIRKSKTCEVLSLCGTVSDKLMSLVLLIPFTFYEICLCLQDIKKQAAKPKTFYKFLALTIILFPIVYIIFIIILLIEIYNLKSILEIDENGYNELKHHFTKKERKITTQKPHFDDYINVNIKIIRAEMKNKNEFSLFSKPSLFAQINISDQILITKSVTSSEMTPLWDEEKDFLITFSEDDPKIEISICDEYDGETVGIFKCSIKEWIANGRFEGAVELTSSSSDSHHNHIHNNRSHKNIDIPVGTASIAVKVSVVKLNGTSAANSPRAGSVAVELNNSSALSLLIPGPKESILDPSSIYLDDRVRSARIQSWKLWTPGRNKILQKRNKKVFADLSMTTTSELLATTISRDPLDNTTKKIFTDADRDRIFHCVGFEKGKSYFRKNPYAYEIHTDMKQLLRELHRNQFRNIYK